MQRQLEEQRDVAERLKKEGLMKAPTAKEVRIRVANLEKEAKLAGSESKRESTEGLFKATYSTDLLFLIDATFSMDRYIEEAKNQVKAIINELEQRFFGEAKVRVAVVAYRDHCDNPNIEFLDFTTNVEQVRSFLDGLQAIGGGDEPEDVLGGIQKAVNASWMYPNRCIMHIADAPPHGRILHNLEDDCDSYAEPGSEPHRLTYKPLLRQMVKLGVNYVALRVNNSIDRMAYLFYKEYATASSDCNLLESNRYYSQALKLSPASRSGLRGGGTSSTTSLGSSKGALLFEEAELGTSYSQLRHLVVRSVTSSACRTAIRMSATNSRAPRSTSKGDRRNLVRNSQYTYLTTVDEGEEEDTIPFEDSPPLWDFPNWLDETLQVQGFAPEGVVHGATTLNDMMADDKNIRLSTIDLTIHKRSKPFGQGAMRIVYYARTAVSTNRFVVKAYKEKEGRSPKGLAHMAEDMRCQTLCKAFALEFNALTGGEHTIDFIVTACLKGISGTSDVDYLSLEPCIPGEYVKYNGNTGYIKKDVPEDGFNKAAQAFSHFTFERSRGEMLVCDLQGSGCVLTDPVVHTRDAKRFKLSSTNFNKAGFKYFFATHDCNAICRKLGLQSNREMVARDRFDFRTSWPILDQTVCCSNKLCGKIINTTEARGSSEFPDRFWCDACWPQLASSKLKLLCRAPGHGEHHEFEVSRFFFESQGQVMPQMCPRHGGESVSTAAVVSQSLWSKLKFANRSRS